MAIIRKDVTLSWDPQRCMCPSLYASPAQLSLCCLRAWFQGKYEIGFLAALIVFTRRRNPHKMLLRSCHKTTGAPVPCGLAWKVRWCPSLCVRSHTLAYLFVLKLFWAYRPCVNRYPGDQQASVCVCVCVVACSDIRNSICDLRDGDPLFSLVGLLFFMSLQTPAGNPNSLEDKYLINIQLHLHRKHKSRKL